MCLSQHLFSTIQSRGHTYTHQVHMMCSNTAIAIPDRLPVCICYCIIIPPSLLSGRERYLYCSLQPDLFWIVPRAREGKIYRSKGIRTEGKQGRHGDRKRAKKNTKSEGERHTKQKEMAWKSKRPPKKRVGGGGASRTFILRLRALLND